MTIAFQVLLLIMILFSFFDMLNEPNKETQSKLLAFTLSTVIAYIITLFLF